MEKAEQIIFTTLAVASLMLPVSEAFALPQYSVSGELPGSAIVAGPSLYSGQRLQRSKEPVSGIATRPQKLSGNRLASRGASFTERSQSTYAPRPPADQEHLLLAQLDADLLQAEKRLDTAGNRLSAGQKELMTLTSTLRAVMNESGTDGAGLHPFVRVASRYAGTPYVWGGESRYGFDCSGLIIRVMRDLGYKALPHSAAEQFKYGTPIAQNLLKPGDIVFFANTYKPGISHVGIYIGKRRFIHAANTRQGTIVSSLDAAPYREKYAGARRLNVITKP